MSIEAEHDVVIVGASLAGCAAATLFARQGLRVALIERSPDPAAYKTACTHFIQASATPTLRRLGLADAIEEAGGIRNSLDLWTRYGWSHHPGLDGVPHGYSIRRQTLDPLVRRMASEAPGVSYLSGLRATDVIHESDSERSRERRPGSSRDERSNRPRERGSGRIAGVRATARDGSVRELTGRLVVAADGRSSTLAELAEVPTRSWPNRRLSYFAYFRDLPLETGDTGLLWFLDPEVAYAFPNDDGLTLITYWARQSDRAEFADDPDGVVRERFARLPRAPRLEQGKRESPWIGRLDMPNAYRHAVHDGMALIGDAAQTSDPVWGVGCGWAFQSAEWLVEATAPALAQDGDLASGLGDYARQRRREIALHHFMICDYSSARGFRPHERLLFAAAADDPAVAQAVHSFANRIVPVYRLASPTLVARIGLSLARRVVGSIRGGTEQAAPA